MKRLIGENWNPAVKEQLNKLLNNINIKNEKRFAVLDWDNSCVFNDTSRTFLLEQLFSLHFKLTPQEMEYVLKKDVPKDNYLSKFKTLEGKPINIDLMVKDIVNAYEVLYKDLIIGTKTLKEIKQTEHYKEFVTKYYYNYQAVIASFGPDLGYVWSKYSMTNLTTEDVENIILDGLKKQLKNKIEEVTFTSSGKIKSNTGVLITTALLGYRFIDEMRELINVLKENNIDVYICSASCNYIINPVITNKDFGYGINKKDIFAMQFEKLNGIIRPNYKANYPVTVNEGKAKIIELIANDYENKNPVLTVGDSNGDVFMLSENVDKVLIINKNPSGKIAKLIEKAKTDNRYLVQGRDDNTGKFVKSDKTIELRRNEKQAVA